MSAEGDLKNLNIPTVTNDDFEDILSDVKNLFIEEAESEEKVAKMSEPRVIYEKTVEDGTKAQIKEKEQKDVKISQPVIKKDTKKTENKIITETKEPKNNKGTESKDTKADTKNNKGDNDAKDNTEVKATTPSVCKGNSDCDSGSYCHQKSGNCKQKFLLNSFGCTANDQCATDSPDGLVVCYKKKCSKACKLGSNYGWCSEGAERCTEVKDSKLFQGLTFNGICTKGTVSSKSSSDGMSKSSIVFLSTASILLFIASIIGFIYIRGYMRRRYRNNNPDMFLFNKLQQSTNQSLQSVGKGSVGSASEQLNSRISNTAGARFTRWAVLSDNQQG